MKCKGKVVVFRPTYDNNLKNLTEAGEILIDFLFRYNVQVVNIKKHHISRNHVNGILNKGLNKYEEIVVYYGHGSDDCSGDGMYGSPQEYILDINNLELVANRYIFANACHCAKSHGEKSIQKGAKAYVGFSGKLWVPDPDDYCVGFSKVINMPFFEIILNANSDFEDTKRRVFDEYFRWKSYWEKRDFFITVIFQLNSELLEIFPIQTN